MNRLEITLLTMCLYINVNSQNIDNKHDIWIEALYETLDENQNQQDINNIIEYLSEYIEHPFNINTITKEELETIPFLSARQIENLLYYIYVYGDLKSLNELRLVEDFDKRTIDVVSPFFYVDSSESNVHKLLITPYSELLIRYNRVLNDKMGYVDKSDSLFNVSPNKKYLADPNYASLKYKIEAKNKYRIGLNLEKDAGEKLFNKKGGGFDYVSAYINLKNIGFLKNIIIGNYRIKFGQGIVINNGFQLDKTMAVSNLNINNQSLTPHSSTDEYNYLQGIASELMFSKYLLTTFVSYRRLDGIVNDSNIVSIKEDGLHNLFREENKRNKASLLSTGAHIEYSYNTFSLGFSLVNHHFNKPLNPTYREYNKYYFRDDNIINISTNYLFRYKHLLFNGETALSHNGKFATLNSLQYFPSSYFSGLILFRNYSKEYYSMFSKSFSESSDIMNEKGVYFLASIKPISFLELKTGIDFFSFPWLKYGIDKPSKGFEYFLHTNYQPYSSIRVSLRYRLKKKEKNTSDKDIDIPVTNYFRHSLNAVLTWNINRYLIFKNGVYGIMYNHHLKKKSNGYGFMQQLGSSFDNIRLTLDIGYSIFNTDNSSSTLYLYEKNLLYSFSYPSVYGRGYRGYLVVKYDLFKNMTFWLKTVLTHYFDRNSIGSSLDLINGRNKSDIWCQLRYNF
ncbi:MAG: helix-hairpin-helix domain-containing protein [Bacteroidales bacterium]|nr:helix-hairpin-helix domain-containing protein [Bacteroidales bacterium]